MSQRNMLYTPRIYDLDSDHSHHPPEPCILAGNVVDSPNPNSHHGLPLLGNIINHDRHPSEQRDSGIFYRSQYNSLQHQHSVSSLDLGGTGPPNLSFNAYVPSSTTRISPMPSNNGSSYIASSSNHGMIGFAVDEYGRNHHLMDNVRGSGKRKNAEGLHGNYFYSNDPACSSSSSLGAYLNSGLRQREEPYVPPVSQLEATTFTPSEYSGSGVQSTTGGSQRSVRSRSSAVNLQLGSSLAHPCSQSLHVNHRSGSFLPASSAWVEQFGDHGGNGGISNWNYGSSHSRRSISGGSLEIGNMDHQSFQDTTSSRNSGIILCPSSVHHHHQQMQGVRSRTYGGPPQISAPSHRYLTNTSHHGTLNYSRDAEPGSRYLRPFTSSADRVYRSQWRMPPVGPDDINQRLRLLSSNDVAMMEFSSFYGVGNITDQHRDMRLDIDDMSYEELLALEEQIGDVSTGLSEETISNCLQTRKYILCTASSPLDQPTDMVMLDKETCVICQAEYEESEKIGVLDCGHDYHAHCIKQWLLIKNICPICKASALAVDKKESE